MTDADEIKDHLKSIREAQIKQEKSLTRMETAFFGDEVAGIKGMVKVQQDHALYIKKQKYLKQKLIGAFAVLSFIWSLLLLYIKEKFLK